ncbi:hypothetical protein [Croceibacterium aestuarii]|uniref:hypothetical protein n=1 Tax=Croceibacterium aestuarii TaxID=3064139 RepID=UPI00272EA047|nr:hypothetical protein [Croceibacterium sp. D39]
MTGARTRGQPLLVFASIIGVWLVARVLFWEAPFPALASIPHHLPPEERSVARSSSQSVGPGLAPTALPNAGGQYQTAAEGAPRPVPTAASSMVEAAAAPFAHLVLAPGIAALGAERGKEISAAPVADRPLLSTRPAPVATARWSGDGWLQWRDGSGRSVAPGAASYGRSQGGAVVRYRLADGGARPEVFARVTHTLEGPREGELAAGISARAIVAVPLRFAAEARVTDTAAGRELRPAVFAVTELVPAPLTHTLRAEAYAQAGWVGGQFATGFIDGQVRVDGRLARYGAREGELRVGLAAWGGAQKGAARLDAGPSATVALGLGEVRTRVALDYRFRVAGDAAPASGPALTFSAGF